MRLSSRFLYLLASVWVKSRHVWGDEPIITCRDTDTCVVIGRTCSWLQRTWACEHGRWRPQSS